MIMKMHPNSYRNRHQFLISRRAYQYGLRACKLAICLVFQSLPQGWNPICPVRLSMWELIPECPNLSFSSISSLYAPLFYIFRVLGVIPVPSAQYRIKASDLLADQPDEPVLVVRSIADHSGSPIETDEIAILSDPSALGLGSVSYLVYGIPGTDQYVFFDLNNLPANYRATLTLGDTSGQVYSVNNWEAKNGNSPQPTDTE